MITTGCPVMLDTGLWMLDFLKDFFFLYPVSSIQSRHGGISLDLKQ
jgi:hypothetical protein